jgi:hypothetical protein
MIIKHPGPKDHVFYNVLDNGRALFENIVENQYLG